MRFDSPDSDPFLDRPARGGFLRFWGLLVGAFALLLLPGAGWLLYQVLPYSILCPSRAERWNVYHNCTPGEYGLTAEDMWVQTEPGLWLRGWHVETKTAPARGTIVLLHGNASCKESMLGLARTFSDQGYSCLLYDSRAQGESGGAYCTYGYYERQDLSHFIDAGERQFGPLGPIAVFGTSLGGAVALQTMPLDARIRCGIVGSTFATLREIVRDYMDHYSGVPFLFLSNIALERAARIAHFAVDEVNPAAAVKLIHQPVLLAHGTDDHWISFHYGQILSQSLTAPGSRWYPVAGADHNDVWQKGGPEYQRLVLNFLDRYCR